MKEVIWMVLGPENDPKYEGGRAAWWDKTRKIMRLKKKLLQLTYPNMVFSGPYKNTLTPAAECEELNA